MDLPVSTFWHIALCSVPAFIVAITAYLLLKEMLNNDADRREVEMRIKNLELATPLRLQAYERLSLFLERISIENLITKYSGQGKSVEQFQRELLMQVRSEFEHNLSQQIYVSIPVWQLIREARENTMKRINEAAKQLPPNTEGVLLGAKIYELSQEDEEQIHIKALKELKKEVRKLY